MARTRKFTTWTFEDKYNGITREVEIRVRGQGTDMVFFAEDEEHGISVESKVAGEIPEKFTEAYKRLLVPEWHPKFLVRCSSKTDRTSRSIKFEWETIVVGENHLGEQMWKRVSLDDYGGVWKGKWVDFHNSRPTTAEIRMSGFNDDGPFVVIDATPESYAAIRQFRAQMEELSKLMTNIFSAEQIENTLTALTKPNADGILTLTGRSTDEM